MLLQNLLFYVDMVNFTEGFISGILSNLKYIFLNFGVS